MGSYSISLKREEHQSSGEFFGTASTAPRYHLNGRNSLLSIDKEDRENLLFSELLLCVIKICIAHLFKGLGCGISPATPCRSQHTRAWRVKCRKKDRKTAMNFLLRSVT